MVPKPQFTRRERQVLDQMAAGNCNAEIAGSLCLTKSAVNQCIHRLYTRLGIHGPGSRKRLIIRYLAGDAYSRHDDQASAAGSGVEGLCCAGAREAERELSC